MLKYLLIHYSQDLPFIKECCTHSYGDCLTWYAPGLIYSLHFVCVSIHISHQLNCRSKAIQSLSTSRVVSIILCQSSCSHRFSAAGVSTLSYVIDETATGWPKMNPLSYLIQRPFPRAWQSSFAIKLPVCNQDDEAQPVLTQGLASHQFRVPTAYTSSRHFTTSQSLFRGRRKKRPFVPSPGQQKIVKLCAEHNVVVSARPGSGKTATAEAIVAAYPHLRVAVLCYSKALQLDTQRRLKKYPNVEAFTFHKMARLLFDAELYEDITLSQEIQNTIALNKLPHGHFEPFDIIVLDEFQDCTDLIFRLVIIFIRANEAKRLGRPSRIVVLGDERQSIYQFRGADYRYLTAAPELLGPLSPWSFAQLPLDQSFRLSKETVQFVNDAFLGGEAYISSSKSGPKPIILNCDPFDKYTLAKELLPLIKHYGAKNTAIIAPAIRNNKPLKSLANVLVEKFGVPIAEPIDEDGPLNDDVIKGKLCISTIHQFKGRERELVILSGMDASFYRYAGRHLPDDRCPNEVFVALTRAVEQLVLIHDAKQKPMPFVNLDALYKTADVINLEDKVSKIRSPDDPGRPVEYGLSLPTLIGVSDIARHARGDYLEKFSVSWSFMRFRHLYRRINISNSERL